MLITCSNNYHSYNTSVQFYKALCTYVIVNRSPMCSSPALPRICFSNDGRKGLWHLLCRQVRAPDAGPRGPLPGSPFEPQLHFRPRRGGEGGEEWLLCGVTLQVPERLNKSARFLLNVKDLLVSNACCALKQLRGGTQVKFPWREVVKIAEVKTSRLQMWPSAFISLVIFFKNKC